jgi:GDPmannose 4,6-dehydratase
MKAIVFGAGGQDGHYLSALLAGRGVQAIGISRSTGARRGDVGDRSFVDELIRGERPDYIFHLAANSTTRHDVIFENHETISTGALNILEAARLHRPGAKVFIAGSAMQFLNTGAAINEHSPFEASSPYAVARIQATYVARYFRQKFAMRVYCGFLFNHDSPLRTEKHVNRMIVDAVKRIAQGSDEPLVLGDLAVQKEFGYAGDVAEAIWLLMDQDDVFEVVIGTGRAYAIEDWVAYCFGAVGEDWRNHVVVKQGFQAEYTRLVSDNSLLLSLGWRPRVGFEQLADLMLAGK